MQVTNPEEQVLEKAKTKGVATVRMTPEFYDELSTHVKTVSETQRQKDGEEISLNKWCKDAIERKLRDERAALERSVSGGDNQQSPM